LDYRLAHGKTGFELIARLRRSFGEEIPAFLISGDTAPERLQEARASGYLLVHKPVPPITLRAILNQLLTTRSGAEASPPAAADGAFSGKVDAGFP
jgi:CheY-like chemotaxis protein